MTKSLDNVTAVSPLSKQQEQALTKFEESGVESDATDNLQKKKSARKKASKRASRKASSQENTDDLKFSHRVQKNRLAAKSMLNTRIPLELHNQLREACHIHSLYMGDFVEIAIIKALADLEEEMGSTK